MRLKTDYLKLRLMLLVIACFLIGLGAKMAGSSTLGADVIVLVWEGLNRTFGLDMGTSNIIVSLVFATLALHEKFKTSIPKNKFFIDASCVIIAAILGQWPTIGPVVSLIISGVIMDQTMVILKKFLPIK